MSRSIVPAAVILAALLSPLPLRAAPPFELKSLQLDLPDSDRSFPAGPGADAINGNCLACHSAGMVLNQPALPKAAWAAEVDKMINSYEAPIAAGDVPAIVDYLARIKGQG
jgi:hypothetical protein